MCRGAAEGTGVFIVRKGGPGETLSLSAIPEGKEGARWGSGSVSKQSVTGREDTVLAVPGQV